MLTLRAGIRSARIYAQIIVIGFCVCVCVCCDDDVEVAVMTMMRTPMATAPNDG